MGGDGPAWQESYEDPIRGQLPDSTEEIRNHGTSRVVDFKNDFCTAKLVLMHRPTHQPHREQSGEYPFSWHLQGRKRLWEFRLQLRFQQLPQGQTYFGIELDRYVPVSGLARQVQKALVSACNKVVGDCYHTCGQDPAEVQGEVEKPAFVMPLWAFDQFEVSEPGKEPSLLGDLTGVGRSRADGVSVYIKALRDTINSLSTDKVYTFSFWGISKYLDIMQWEVCGGLMPGVKMDFNKLCGSPPVFFTIYSLQGISKQDKDQRHLQSRKRQYFRFGFWSTLRPPPPAGAGLVAAQEECDFDYWSGMAGFEDLMQPAANNLDSSDLLGLSAAPEKSPEATAKGVQSKADTCDLLGLDLLG